jgi:hypothetical protein
MVSAAIKPAMFPDTGVTITNPERIVVLWAKAPSKFPEHQIASRTRMNKRMA